MRVHVALVVAFLASGLALRACPPAQAATLTQDTLGELQRIEERLIRARATVAYWRSIADLAEPQLTHCTDAALARRAR